MAVFTKLSQDDLNTIIANYNIGNVTDYQAIEKGVENTNFFLQTNQGKFVLTIFEKKFNKSDLPFFLELMAHLNQHNFPAPQIFRNNKEILNFNYQNKTGIIISFLAGELADNIPINNEIIYNLGKKLAEFHATTQNFNKNRNNQYSLSYLVTLTEKLISKKSITTPEIKLLTDLLPKIKFLDFSNLPQGIIHADLFPDNVFITNNDISGLIDFYFACKDYLIFDIAITINAWCFDHKQNINLELFHNFIAGYQKIRSLTIAEKKHFHNFAIIAALRFYLSRSIDKLAYKKDDLVTAKDPHQYYKILEFYNKNNLVIP
jgi:homoserine kinase type II